MSVEDRGASTATAEEDAVDRVIASARDAQLRYAAAADQALYDRAAKAAAWALMEPGRNLELSTLAVQSTGLGNVEDKVIKNHRKTLGLLRDIEGVRTVGMIDDDKASGISAFARPIGVIGAVVPSTNPAATPVNNVVNALKCGNAIVLSPSPKGVPVAERLLAFMHEEFRKADIDPDLVQLVPSPSSKVKTQRLMEEVDLIIVTGSQDNVRRAYTSGTPALGVGAGNATVLIDETADLDAAARLVAASKTFDNATSCSSENVLIVVDAVHDAFLDALHAVGGRVLDAAQSRSLKNALFGSGHLNRDMIAKDIDAFLAVAGVEIRDADAARFVVLPSTGVGPDFPESGEKLSLCVALYRADDFADALGIARTVLDYQGAGHSIGIHTNDDSRAVRLAQTMPTCRVIVNQAHCFATGGSFENGSPFSLSMGCGSWGGNSIDTNLNYRHFINTTRVVRPIPPNEPALGAIFEDYWMVAGK